MKSDLKKGGQKLRLDIWVGVKFLVGFVAANALLWGFTLGIFGSTDESLIERIWEAKLLTFGLGAFGGAGFAWAWRYSPFK